MNLDDLLEEFNVVIDSKEGLSELRSLILGLAVRGKLVAQDPNDEPASELLEKIEAEKQRLYEEGEIRKPKKLKSVSPEEYRFTIPSSWVWVRLGYIFDIYTGNSISKLVKEERYTRVEGQTYIGTKDVNYGFQQIDYKTDVAIPDKDLHNFKTAPQGSVLVCSEGGSAGKKCGYVEKDICFGNKLICNVPYYGVNTRLLLGYMQTDLFQEQFSENLAGIIGGISQANYNDLIFPLPPLNEQNQIVIKFESLLTEVDELEAKLNKQTKIDQKLQLAVNAEVQQAPDNETSKTAWEFITNNFETLYHNPEAIDNLKKNILNEAVRGRLVPQDPNDEPASELLKKIEAEKQRLYKAGEIRKPMKLPPVEEDEILFELPKGWVWTRLGIVSTYGNNTSINPGEINDDTWVLDLADIEKDTSKIIDFDTFKNRKSKSNKYVFNKGDVLYGKLRPYLNKVAIAVDDGVCTTEIIPLKVLSDMSNNYLLYSLKRQGFLDYVNAITYGTKMPRLGTDDGRKALIPLPPRKEQYRIVQRIEELFAICDRFIAQLEQRQEVNVQLVKGLVKEVLEGS